MTASTHLNDTKNFGQIDPGKTPVWGKPVREREFFLFLQILEITSAKIKPAVYLSLPFVFRAWNVQDETQQLQPRNLCINSRTVRTVRTFGKSCPDFNATVQWPYGLYGPLNAPLLPWKTCYSECITGTKISAVPNPYRTDLFFCWLPR